MRAAIDQEGCIQCGLCVDTCPAVFRMSADGPAEVYVDEIPKDAEEAAKEAAQSCPVDVISIEE